MAPKKASGSSKAGEEKRKVVRKAIEFKKELITKYESGVRVSVLAKEFGMAKHHPKSKDQLKASKVAEGSTLLKYKSCFLDLERIKIIYINPNRKNCFGFQTAFWNGLCSKTEV